MIEQRHISYQLVWSTKLELELVCCTLIISILGHSFYTPPLSPLSLAPYGTEPKSNQNHCPHSNPSKFTPLGSTSHLLKPFSAKHTYFVIFFHPSKPILSRPFQNFRNTCHLVLTSIHAKPPSRIQIS